MAFTEEMRFDAIMQHFAEGKAPVDVATALGLTDAADIAAMEACLLAFKSKFGSRSRHIARKMRARGVKGWIKQTKAYQRLAALAKNPWFERVFNVLVGALLTLLVLYCFGWFRSPAPPAPATAEPSATAPGDPTVPASGPLPVEGIPPKEKAPEPPPRVDPLYR